jgi:hypothetical protein
LKDPLFLVSHASDVSYEFGYIVWLKLRTESRHLPSTLGDHFCQFRIALLLNFLGAQVLGVHCLAGCAVSTTIGRVADNAVRFVNFGGIGLGLRCGWQSQAAQDTCWNKAQKKLSHVYLLKKSLSRSVA